VYEVGDLLLGVRWSTDELIRPLRQILVDLHRPHENAPPNFGVVTGVEVGGRRTKHTLYRANKRMIRTASAGRLLRALIRGLAEFDLAPRSPGTVRLAATPVVAGDGVHILDRRLGWMLDDMAPRLARAGLGVVDAGLIDFDPAGGTVDLTLPGPWPARWKAAADHPTRPDRLEAEPGAGRLPVRQVLVARMTPPGVSIPPAAAALSLVAEAEQTPPTELAAFCEGMAGHAVVVEPDPEVLRARLVGEG
jgi:hypothetical protein